MPIVHFDTVGFVVSTGEHTTAILASGMYRSNLAYFITCLFQTDLIAIFLLSMLQKF